MNTSINVGFFFLILTTDFITIRITKIMYNEALFGMTEKDKKNLLQRGCF